MWAERGVDVERERKIGTGARIRDLHDVGCIAQGQSRGKGKAQRKTKVRPTNLKPGRAEVATRVFL